jgi:hypothetical protein
MQGVVGGDICPTTKPQGGGHKTAWGGPYDWNGFPSGAIYFDFGSLVIFEKPTLCLHSIQGEE